MISKHVLDNDSNINWNITKILQQIYEGSGLR